MQRQQLVTLFLIKYHKDVPPFNIKPPHERGYRSGREFFSYLGNSWNEWPACLYQWQTSSGIHRVRDLFTPGTGLQVWAKRTFPAAIGNAAQFVHFLPTQ